MSHTQLETEIENLSTRRDEIRSQLADVQADEKSALEAVIAGASPSELQSIRAQLATLTAIDDELNGRLCAAVCDLAAAKDAEERVVKVAQMKARADGWTAHHDQTLEIGRRHVAHLKAFLPLLLELSHLADERRLIVEDAEWADYRTEEIGLSFDAQNAHSLFAPLAEGLSEADHAALWLLYQHYARFAAIAENTHRFYREK